MKTKILKLLRGQETYISGQELCNQLGVSRTAVWKVINQLKESGYGIEAVPNRGYHIVSYPDILSKEEIESQVETRKIGKKVLYLNKTSSTNIEAAQVALEEDEGLLVVADIQTAGKGRRGRAWTSPKRTGIWMSMLLKPQISPSSASMVTLVTALAAVRAMNTLKGIKAEIKWPNDIVVNGKKVCGILTEMNCELDFIHYVVVGIGINANMKEFPEEVEKVATSLFLEAGKKVNRGQLIVTFLKEFEVLYETFVEQENLSFMKTEYESHLVNRNKQVRVIELKNTYTGVARGINEQGELRVELSDGEIKEIISGEVSVRGIYGYV